MRDLEVACYSADRAFRQYNAIDPRNRLVAAELELRWNRTLTRVGEIRACFDIGAITSVANTRHRARRQSQGCVGGADDRCKAQDAHRSHRHPGGGRRYQ